MSDVTNEQWKLLHAVRSEACKTKCGDPVCDHGCLQQAARDMRGSIMRGIKLSREEGSNDYPYMVIDSLHKHTECKDGSVVIGRHGSTDIRQLCSDPVCKVAGCLSKPAWHYRELIKADQDDEIFRALKKHNK